jgi:uncharacterized protein (DUF4415 family)
MQENGESMKKIHPAWTNKSGDVRALPAEFFEAAQPFTAAELKQVGAAPRGRPKSPTAKKLQSFKLSPDVIEGIKKSGAGYNARVEKVLRDALANGVF